MNIKKYLKNHFYIQIANIFFLFTAFLINIYLSKGGLSNNDFGVYNLMTTLLASLSTIFTAGFPFYATKKLSRKDIGYKDFVGIALVDFVTCMLFIAVLIIFSPFIGSLIFTNNNLSSYLIIVAVALPSYLYSGFILAFVSGKQQFKRQALFLIISHSVKLLVVIVLSRLFGAAGAVAGYAVPGIVLLISAFIIYRKKFKITIPEIFSFTAKYFKNKDLWTYVVPLTMFAFINTAIISKDLLLIENIRQATDLTDYSIITLIGRVPVYIFQALGTVIFPMYATLNTKSAMKKEFFKDISMQFLLACFVIVGYIIFGSLVLRILYTQEFAEKYYLSLIITAVSGISYAVFGLVCVKLQAINKQVVTLIAVIASFAVINIFGETMVRNYGLEGASLNLLISTFPVFIILVVYLLFYLKKGQNNIS